MCSRDPSGAISCCLSECALVGSWNQKGIQDLNPRHSDIGCHCLKQCLNWCAKCHMLGMVLWCGRLSRHMHHWHSISECGFESQLFHFWFSSLLMHLGRPATHVGDPDAVFGLLASVWPSPSHCSHLRSEPANGRPFYHSLSLPFKWVNLKK